MKSLDEWLNYIESVHPSDIELGLDRVARVAKALAVDSLPSLVITVAGTNGKGSTVAYLQHILTAAGYTSGCYTSPHFLDYNERVTLAGQPVSDALLCQAFAAIDAARQDLGIDLTYFEFGTLAALLIFKEAAEPLDVVLLEVGLGGRLDAVNIVDPDIAVVTTVALDHQDWLGNDREVIGREKAGIFRPGRYAIYGEPDMPASVKAVADELQVKLRHWGRDFVADRSTSSWSWSGRDHAGVQRRISDIPYPGLPFENALTAIQACLLTELEISDAAIQQGLAAAQLTGRNQQLSLTVGQGKEARVLLDVAHNPHAALHLAQQLAQESQPVICVAAMLADKDIATTLQALEPYVETWLLADLDVPRGAKAQQLAATISGTALSGVDAALSGVNSALSDTETNLVCFDTVLAAFKQALLQVKADQLIVVTGSFYTIAQVLEDLDTAL